jgi:hypothetical protein
VPNQQDPDPIEHQKPQKQAKKDIKGSDIRKAMGNRMKQRKLENKSQLQAY